MIKYLLTAALKNKTNWMVGLFSLCLILVFYGLNVKNQDTYGYRQYWQHEYQYALNDDNSKEMDFDLNHTQTIAQILEALDQKDIKQAYRHEINLLNSQMEALKLSNQHNNEYYTRRIHLLNYLYQHDLNYEPLEYPISGLGFWTSMSTILIPILFLFSYLYITIPLALTWIHKDMSYRNIFPLSRFKIELNIWFAMSGIGLFLMMIYNSFSLLVGSIFNGFGSLNYPIWFELKSSYQPAGSMIWQNISLQLLFCLALSSVVLLLSKFIKNELILLLVILSGVLLFSFGATFLTWISGLLPWLFSTYLRSMYVLTDMSYERGLIVLSITTALCLVGNLVKRD